MADRVPVAATPGRGLGSRASGQAFIRTLTMAELVIQHPVPSRPYSSLFNDDRSPYLNCRLTTGKIVIRFAMKASADYIASRYSSIVWPAARPSGAKCLNRHRFCKVRENMTDLTTPQATIIPGWKHSQDAGSLVFDRAQRYQTGLEHPQNRNRKRKFSMYTGIGCMGSYPLRLTGTEEHPCVWIFASRHW